MTHAKINMSYNFLAFYNFFDFFWLFFDFLNFFCIFLLFFFIFLAQKSDEVVFFYINFTLGDRRTSKLKVM